MSFSELAKAAHVKATDWLYRRPIVFHHVPKCAGTSVTRSLRRAYILSQASVRPEEAVRAFNALRTSGAGEGVSRVSDFIEMMFLYQLYCGTRCVAGHIPFSDVAFERFSSRYSFVTVLRDPVERFISNYYWNRSRPVGDRRIEVSLEEFVKTEEARFLGSTYVRYFCGGPRPRQFTTEDVARAIHNLRRLHLVGFLDDMPAFASNLRQLTGRRLRVGRDNVMSAAAKHHEPISESVLQRIVEACSADRQVWDAVQDLRQAPVRSSGIVATVDDNTRGLAATPGA